MEEIKKGRIIYFEPNEFTNTNNLTINQEDLTKYVNLSVRIPSRFYNECTFSKYDSVLQGRKFKEVIGEKEYVKLFLTDSYVNVSYNEIKSNGEFSSGELFGIDSIDISFDVQFFPQVKINFTDVRGFGLMSTMENSYFSNEVKNLTAKSFFTSLFNFPYPIFTLEVKGYYGKSVSFDLSLLDFHTFFDSQNGNFKTQVTFIGHMWGVLGDIPMGYLMMSPYIDYNGETLNNGDEKIGDVWKHLNYEEIPTYISILDKYDNLLNGITTSNINNFEEVKKYKDNTNKINNLQQLHEYFKSIILKCQNNFENIHIVRNSANILEIYYGNQETTNNNGDFYDEENDIISYITTSTTLNEEIFEIEEIKKIGYKNYLPNISNSATTSTNEYIFTFNNLNKNVKDIENEINVLKNDINQSDINEKLIKIVEESIGFKPTIKNIYKIIFKHLNCFSEHFYNTIKNIKNNRAKNIISKEYFTDVPDKIDLLPPFPMVGETNTKKIVYPGTINEFKNEPEIILTENIYNSINYFNNVLKDATENIEKSRYENIENNSIYNDVLLFSDFRNDINDNLKHYNILNNKLYKGDYTTTNNIAEGIRDIFLARVATYGKIHYVKDEIGFNENKISDIESKLLLSAFPNMSKDLVNELKNYNNNIEVIKTRFTELSGGTDWGFVNYTPGAEKEVDLENLKRSNQIHSNDDLKSCLIILKHGTQGECESYYNTLQDNNVKTNFNSQPKNYKTITQNNTDVFIYENGKIKTYNKDDVKFLVGKHYKKAYYNNDYSGQYDVHFYSYVKNTYITPNIDFLHYVFDEYSYSDDKTYIRTSPWRTSDISTGTNFRFDKKEKSERELLNKIGIVQLSDLLSIGEYFWFKNESENKYDIVLPRDEFPLEFLNNDNEFIVPENNESTTFTNKVAKDFECNEIFKKFCLNLYKKIILKLDIEDNKYLEYLENLKLPDDIYNTDDFNDYDDYYFVIAKNFEYNPIDIPIIGNKYFIFNNIETIWKAFVGKLDSIFNKTPIDTVYTSNNDKKSAIEGIKSDIYYTLKTLYDKWMSGLNRDYFAFNNNNSQFDKVNYLTTTFEDISNSLIVNVENLVNQILSITNNANELTHSVISFMAKTAQDNHCTFLSLPLNINHNNVESIFKPYSFYNNSIEHDKQGVTYLVLHHGNVSHNLDISESDYFNDGYDIANYVGNEIDITPEAAAIHVSNEHDKNILAFGVTYGMQNQNYFRNISVDTTTPSVTDYSIANTLSISEQGSQMSVSTQTVNKQSLYPIYANRSYTCSVDMMGCMEITPLMYFQLNNVPMFRGAYLITNVNHRITPDDFVTTFTGVRVSKYKIPLNKEVINIGNIGRYLGGESRKRSNLPESICLKYRDKNSEEMLKNLGVPKYITIHTSDGTGQTVCDYHIMHIKQDGFMGIGYHFFIDKEGKIYPGTPINKKGTHVSNNNSGNIGICFEGLKEEPNEKQSKSLTALIYCLMEYYSIPYSNVKGHRDWNNTKKTCPNFDVQTTIFGENKNEDKWLKYHFGYKYSSNTNIYPNIDKYFKQYGLDVYDRTFYFQSLWSHFDENFVEQYYVWGDYGRSLL